MADKIEEGVSYISSGGLRVGAVSFIRAYSSIGRAEPSKRSSYGFKSRWALYDFTTGRKPGGAY